MGIVFAVNLENFCGGYFKNFVKIKSSRNGEIILSFINLGKSPPSGKV